MLDPSSLSSPDVGETHANSNDNDEEYDCWNNNIEVSGGGGFRLGNRILAHIVVTHIALALIAKFTGDSSA